jgi:hypothetical protein
VKWGFLPKDDRPRYLICNAGLHPDRSPRHQYN